MLAQPALLCRGAVAARGVLRPVDSRFRVRMCIAATRISQNAIHGAWNAFSDYSDTLTARPVGNER